MSKNWVVNPNPLISTKSTKAPKSSPHNKTSFLQLHFFSSSLFFKQYEFSKFAAIEFLFSFFFSLFFLDNTNLKIKARTRQYIYIHQAWPKIISSNETYPPTLIPKTFPKLQNSLRVRCYHGFSLKACNELQNKERGTLAQRGYQRN